MIFNNLIQLIYFDINWKEIYKIKYFVFYGKIKVIK